MGFQVVCDINGEIEETSGTTVGTVSIGVLSLRRPALPDGWRYVEVPMPDGEKRCRVVCPACLVQLWGLFDIEHDPVECVRCGHLPVKHRGPNGCQECGCELSEPESTDPGWETGS